MPETVIMAVPNMSIGQVVAADTDKIDVWDFGAEQLDTSVYNNMITVDEVNSWYSDGQLSFNDGGYPATHRLRTTNESITRYDAKSPADANNGSKHAQLMNFYPKETGMYRFITH